MIRYLGICRGCTEIFRYGEHKSCTYFVAVAAFAGAVNCACYVAVGDVVCQAGNGKSGAGYALGYAGQGTIGADAVNPVLCCTGNGIPGEFDLGVADFNIQVRGAGGAGGAVGASSGHAVRSIVSAITAPVAANTASIFFPWCVSGYTLLYPPFYYVRNV